MANNFEINLDPDAWIPDDTNHPDRGVVQNRTYLAFDAGTNEICYSKAFRMPTAYTGSGTLTCVIGYYMDTATTGNVEFEVTIEAVTDADALDLDSASGWGTVDSTGAVAVPGTQGYLDVASVVFETAAKKDNAAAGDMLRLKLERETTVASNASGDANVLYVTLYEEQ